jgi:hypothetical protein
MVPFGVFAGVQTLSFVTALLSLVMARLLFPVMARLVRAI